MRLVTRERSWRNFWWVVATVIAGTLAIWILRPEHVVLFAVFGAFVIAVLLFDSYMAGRRMMRSSSSVEEDKG